MSKSSRRENNNKIQEELVKYSWKTLDEFQKHFPIDNIEWGIIVEVFPKEGFSNLCYIYLNEEDGVDPYDDFWKRWNRFLNLKAFL